MLTTWLLTAGALLLLIFGWVGVQSLARQTAQRHPASGPFREAGGGCGGGCCGAPAAEAERPNCASGSCEEECRGQRGS